MADKTAADYRQTIRVLRNKVDELDAAAADADAAGDSAAAVDFRRQSNALDSEIASAISAAVALENDQTGFRRNNFVADTQTIRDTVDDHSEPPY